MGENIKEAAENLKKRDLVNETVLYDFLEYLKSKKYIDDWTCEYEKEISLFLYEDILEKHCNLIYGDLLTLFNHDNDMACKVLNLICGKNN
jgi:hypothetical protein